MSYQGKDKLLESLLKSPSKSSAAPLISEINSNVSGDQESVKSNVLDKDGETETETETVTMMDMMLAAQAEAQKAKVESKEKEEKKTSKAFGNGFKKGFFGSSSSSENDKSKSLNQKKISSVNTINSNNSNSSSNVKVSVHPTASASASSSNSQVDNVPLVSKKDNKTSSLVLEEVQSAMKDPMIDSLKKGDWVTSDLKEKISSNTIFQRGLNNPKCIAAMQLMQTNPKEAEKKFKGDPEVEEFIKEFGKIMGSHFSELGNTQDQQNESNSLQGHSPVSEIGPLHAQAIANNKGNKNVDKNTDEDDKRLKEIVQDPELSSLLLDPELQKILMECGDPIKFQYHMRNPETSRKIKKLYENGLVGTTK